MVYRVAPSCSAHAWTPAFADMARNPQKDLNSDHVVSFAKVVMAGVGERWLPLKFDVPMSL